MLRSPFHIVGSLKHLLISRRWFFSHPTPIYSRASLSSILYFGQCGAAKAIDEATSHFVSGIKSLTGDALLSFEKEVQLLVREVLSNRDDGRFLITKGFVVRLAKRYGYWLPDDSNLDSLSAKWGLTLKYSVFYSPSYPMGMVGPKETMGVFDLARSETVTRDDKSSFTDYLLTWSSGAQGAETIRVGSHIELADWIKRLRVLKRYSLDSVTWFAHNFSSDHGTLMLHALIALESEGCGVEIVRYANSFCHVSVLFPKEAGEESQFKVRFLDRPLLVPLRCDRLAKIFLDPENCDF